MVGHRKGGVGGKIPVKASRVMLKLIESCMENARHQYEDIDPEEMVITHCAAHTAKLREAGLLVQEEELLQRTTTE